MARNTPTNRADKQKKHHNIVSKDREVIKMKKVNVVLNLGLVTKNFLPVDKKTAIKIIALSTDATVTECTRSYKGNVEPSLKIEIYDTTLEFSSPFLGTFFQYRRT